MFDKIGKLATNSLIKRHLSTSTSMANSLGAIVDKLNDFAAIKTAENWDNVGLLLEPATPKYVNEIEIFTKSSCQSIHFEF